ncbi:MAG: hypothetical protein OD811_01300 [Alphaproteobacteria bacterium]
MTRGDGETKGRDARGSGEVWRDSSGEALDCEDKILLLNARLEEIESLAQDTFADGLLMGVDEGQLRSAFTMLAGRLRNPWRGRR